MAEPDLHPNGRLDVSGGYVTPDEISIRPGSGLRLAGCLESPALPHSPRGESRHQEWKQLASIPEAPFPLLYVPLSGPGTAPLSRHRNG
jgi:hypothetical protein